MRSRVASLLLLALLALLAGGAAAQCNGKTYGFFCDASVSPVQYYECVSSLWRPCGGGTYCTVQGWQDVGNACTATPPATTSVCGNGVCESGETSTSCAADCPPPPAAVCGNGVCESGETCSSCAADCQCASGSAWSVGYFPYYRDSFASSVQWSKLSDVVYFTLDPRGDGTWAYPSGFSLSTLRALAGTAAALGKRMHVSAGGWGISSGFAQLAASAAARSTFANGILAFLQQNQLHGFNLDWEHPQTSTERSDYVALIGDLAAVLRPAGKLLTVAVPSDTQTLLSSAAPLVDAIFIMSYDHTPAPHTTYAWAVTDTNYWLARGFAASKVVLGIPLYGRNSAGTAAAYRDIVASNTVTAASNEAGGYYFDGVNTVAAKVAFALGQGLRGVMVWELWHDTPTASLSLMNSIASALASGSSAPVCGDGVCSVGEACPADCPAPVVCGDGVCAPGESCISDCGARCGDGTCSPTETCSSCSADCGSCFCNNNRKCDQREDCRWCNDCCNVVTPVCGDGKCNGSETTATCPGDCGTRCGDGVCNGAETTSSCASDCPAPTGPCNNNGRCEKRESCPSCADCC